MTTDLIHPITGQTRCYGLIGEKIAHSKSYSLHNRAFKCLKLNAIYIPLQTTKKDFYSTIEGLKSLKGIEGFNVTYPFKEMIIPCLDELSERAANVGAVNTVVRTNSGQFRGENTDIEGLINALRVFSVDPSERDVLLLGAGGVARSTCWALSLMGCKRLYAYNRTPERLHRLIDDLSHKRPKLSILEMKALAEWQNQNGLIINCTSVGSEDDQSPWPMHLPFPKGSLILDLIYRETSLLRKAKQEGCLGLDGTEMLIQQAALSFSIWTKQEPPIDEMKGL